MKFLLLVSNLSQSVWTSAPAVLSTAVQMQKLLFEYILVAYLLQLKVDPLATIWMENQYFGSSIKINNISHLNTKLSIKV